MDERLLQFIWQFRYFNGKELRSTAGETVTIIHPGRPNANQGPDFLEARIRIGDTLWVGQVELHIRSSDWQKHGHQADKNYENVILHVVWEDDGTPAGSVLPVLSLQDRVSGLLLRQYEAWMHRLVFIPCERQVTEVPALTWLSWKERLLLERLQRKTGQIAGYLGENNQHWEETFWWLLARNFGIRVNAGAFEAIARSLPVNLLSRNKSRQQPLEALLLGQAGLLEREWKDAYPRRLRKDYLFYRNKYGLHPIRQPVHFLRMRPGSFPTVRLAQLAMLLHRSAHLFAFAKEAGSLDAIREQLTVTASAYWDHHYLPDEWSPARSKKLGAGMIDNILINTILPVLFAYGHLRGEPVLKERALDWYQAIAPEKNAILRKFEQLGIAGGNAADTQALLELQSRYCQEKKCLDCAIGNALLKRCAGS